VIRYAGRRLLAVFPVLLGALSLLFFLQFSIPGDRVQRIAGINGKRLDPIVRVNLERKYGLDQPIFVQYAKYLGRTLRGDLGYSFADNRRVSDLIFRNFAASARLAIWAILIEIFVGVGLGVFSARRRNRLADRLVLGLTVIGSGVPVFVGGFLLAQFFGVQTLQWHWPQWMRFVTGIGPNRWFGFIPLGNRWRFLILPAFTLAGVSTASTIRLMRASLLEVGGADYIRTARAKGISNSRVVYRHALRNAIIPVVTALGLDFGVLLGGAILTETVFNWPGIGAQAAGAVERLDIPQVMGITLVILVIYQIVSLLIDLSYGLIDPRIRLERGAS
jgi:ABC-type dipeptide/oligopeptide/nickel transport system permease component